MLLLGRCIHMATNALTTKLAAAISVSREHGRINDLFSLQPTTSCPGGGNGHGPGEIWLVLHPRPLT